METTNNQNAQPTTISGWLIYPLIVLMIQPLILVYKTFSDLASFKNMGLPYHVIILVGHIIYDVILFSLGGILVYLFFTRKRILPGIFIFFIFLVLVTIFFLFTIIRDNNMPIFQITICALTILPCFLFSKRTETTFVAEMNLNKPIDKALKPAEKFFEGFYAFLYKFRKIYFLFIIGLIDIFLLVGVILDKLDGRI